MVLPTECGIDGARWIRREVRPGQALSPTPPGRTLVSITLDTDAPTGWLRALTAGRDAVYELRAAGDVAPDTFVARAKAVRATLPKAILCGPGLPLDAARAHLAAGLLDYLDALSLAQDAPPSLSVAATLERARCAVVLNGASARRRLPILITSCAAAKNEKEALRLVLCHLSAGIPVTVLPDPKLAPGGPLAGMALRHRVGGPVRFLLQRGDSNDLALVGGGNHGGFEDTGQVLTLAHDTRAFGAMRRLASIRFGPGPLVALAGPPDWPTSDISGGQWTIHNHEKRSATIVLTVSSPGQEARRTITIRAGQTAEGRLLSAGPLDRAAPRRAVSVRLRWNGLELPSLVPLPLLRADPLLLSIVDGQLQVDDPAGRGLDAFLVDGGSRRRVFLDRGVRRLTVPVAPGPIRLVNSAGGVLARLDPS